MGEGNYSEGAVAVRRYGAEMEAQHADLTAAAQLFSRVSGRQTALLGRHYTLLLNYFSVTRSVD